MHVCQHSGRLRKQRFGLEAHHRRSIHAKSRYILSQETTAFLVQGGETGTRGPTFGFGNVLGSFVLGNVVSLGCMGLFPCPMAREAAVCVCTPRFLVVCGLVCWSLCVCGGDSMVFDLLPIKILHRTPHCISHVALALSSH